METTNTNRAEPEIESKSKIEQLENRIAAIERKQELLWSEVYFACSGNGIKKIHLKGRVDKLEGDIKKISRRPAKKQK